MLLKASEMPLDSFYSFAEGDIEKFCRIDWDSIRQKFIPEFVQIVHTNVRARAKPLTAVCVYILFFLWLWYW